MAKSKWFKICKDNYPDVWPISRIRIAVELGRITAEEFEEITGQPYEE